MKCPAEMNSYIVNRAETGSGPNNKNVRILLPDYKEQPVSLLKRKDRQMIPLMEEAGNPGHSQSPGEKHSMTAHGEFSFPGYCSHRVPPFYGNELD